VLRHFQASECKLRFFARTNHSAGRASAVACYSITRKFDVDLPAVVRELKDATAPAASPPLLAPPVGAFRPLFAMPTGVDSRGR
jgi:hypothetical protein